MAELKSGCDDKEKKRQCQHQSPECFSENALGVPVCQRMTGPQKKDEKEKSQKKKIHGETPSSFRVDKKTVALP